MMATLREAETSADSMDVSSATIPSANPGSNGSSSSGMMTLAPKRVAAAAMPTAWARRLSIPNRVNSRAKANPSIA